MASNDFVFWMRAIYPAISFYDLFRLGIWPMHQTEQSASITSTLSEFFSKLTEITGIALFQLFSGSVAFFSSSLEFDRGWSLED